MTSTPLQQPKEAFGVSWIRTTQGAGALIGIAVMAVSGCQSGAVAHGAPADHGTEFGLGSHIAVHPGEHFSIAIKQNSSTGESWSVKQQPDPAIATPAGHDFMASNGGAIGGGGTQYFTYTAGSAGKSTITLLDCFRGCQKGKTAPAKDAPQIVTLDVEVK